MQGKNEGAGPWLKTHPPDDALGRQTTMADCSNETKVWYLDTIMALVESIGGEDHVHCVPKEPLGKRTKEWVLGVWGWKRRQKMCVVGCYWKNSRKQKEFGTKKKKRSLMRGLFWTCNTNSAGPGSGIVRRERRTYRLEVLSSSSFLDLASTLIHDGSLTEATFCARTTCD